MNPTIIYTSHNGYTGYMGGMSTLVVTDEKGETVYHTGFNELATYRQLVEFVDGFSEKKGA